MTTYNYAFDNPVNFIDPDGKRAVGPRSPAEIFTVPGGMLDYYSRGGNGSRASIMAWMGQGEPFSNEEMMGPGGGVFSKETDITDSPEYQEAMNMIYTPDFGQFDFSRFGNDNDEEPVNFFGKSGDDAPFYQKFKEMYNFFKGTKGDGVFRAYGHGGVGSIWDGEKEIHDAKGFDILMGERNKNWNNVDNVKDAILILYVCHSGVDITMGQKTYKSFGSKVSKAHPNLTIIAFDEFVTYDNSIKGMRNINKAQNKGDGLGSIVFYKNGEILKRQTYKDFLQKYPNFQ